MAQVNLFHHQKDGASVYVSGNPKIGYTFIRRYPTKQKRKAIVMIEKDVKVVVNLYNTTVKEMSNRENINVKKEKDVVQTEG